MRYETLRLTGKAPIRAFLNQDRVKTAYALGDLDDALWPQSEFWGARRAGDLVSVVMLYRGFDPAVLTAFGDPDGARAILVRIALPGEVYCLIPEELGTAVADTYALPDPHREWRMVLDPAAFDAPPLDDAGRIAPEQADALTALYRHAAKPGEEVVAFSPAQIAQGRFYGIWAGDTMVGAAGTHVWSEAEKVVAIGNVFTRPDRRGRGYATLCAAAVVQDALAAGMDTIILNVRMDNAPAIRVYEKLGFRRAHVFLEGPGLRR